MSEEEDRDYFKFLVITDIHDRIYNVRKVVEIYKNEKIDYVLCCGDIVTVPADKNKDKQAIEPYIPLLKNIMLELEKIAPVIWVPGNHEPYVFFNENYEEATSKSKNLHKKVQKLTKGLYVVGLGGSVPILTTGSWTPDWIPFKDIDSAEILYPGFPYNAESETYEDSDNLLLNDLNETINKAKEEGGDDVTMILLSHLGPQLTSTNYQEEDGMIIYLGSKLLGEKFQNESKILINVHGHTHLGDGFVTLRQIRYVFNPGANFEGQYGTLEIKKNSRGDWTVSSFTIESI